MIGDKKMNKENKESKKEEIVYSKSDSKILRVINFLIEVKESMSKEEIKDLYLNKYKLSERSNEINLRVLERGVYYKNIKVNEEVLLNNRKLLINKIKESNLNINYNKLIEKIMIVKEKNKRSNRLNNFMNVKF